MAIPYHSLFGLMLLITTFVTHSALGGYAGAKKLFFGEQGEYSVVDPERGPSATHVVTESKRRLQLKYLAVYVFMVAGDWLQGPYVYMLYESYGWERGTIAIFFVMGFGSSMILGTCIGSMADKYGRKRFAYLYVTLYIISCLTKHNRTIPLLSIGRLTGGAATSLLMSVFESWVVCEYHKIEPQENKSTGFGSLQQTFSLASLLNFVVAVVSGVVAEGIVDRFPYNEDPLISNSDWFYGKYTAPFDLAIICLGFGGWLISVLWNENYGENRDNSGSTFRNALKQVFGNCMVFCLGLEQACFEGAMYSFIFMWTPAIRQQSEDAPLGKIFSTFMLCSMLGSQLFSLLVQNNVSEDTILLATLFTAMLSLSLGPIDDYFGTQYMYYGFLLFEVCVGLYFPSMGTLKSKNVPDENRSTIYNIFRVPLNAIVLVVLLNDFSIHFTWVLCVMLLAVATCSQAVLVRLQNSSPISRRHSSL